MSEKKMAPKTYQKNHVIYSGNLEKTYAVVHRRKIPIERIRRLMSLDQGLLFRWRESDYDNMEGKITLERLSKLNVIASNIFLYVVIRFIYFTICFC